MPEIDIFSKEFLFCSIPLLLLFTYLVAYFTARIRLKRRWEKEFRKRSHAVVTGLVNEQMAPLLNDFPGTPSDARFIGKPIDYIVFEGLSEGQVSEIIFVEVKSTPSGRLNSNERSVRDAVKEKRVRWIKYSPD